MCLPRGCCHKVRLVSRPPVSISRDSTSSTTRFCHTCYPKRNPLPPSGSLTQLWLLSHLPTSCARVDTCFAQVHCAAVGASFEHVFAFQASVLRSLSASFLFSLSLRLCYTYRHIWAVRRPTESRNRPPSSSCAKPRLSALFHHKRDTRTIWSQHAQPPKQHAMTPKCREVPHSAATPPLSLQPAR